LEIQAEEAGEGSPALVFIHYWGGSRRTWSEVIARLSNRFRSIAVDLRGWGKSARHTDDYSLFTQADDVEGVIKALNVKDFVLVGHFMGGKIAQILAGRRLDGLRAVVLVAPAPPTPVQVPDAQKRTMFASYTMPEGIGEALKVISHQPSASYNRPAPASHRGFARWRRDRKGCMGIAGDVARHLQAGRLYHRPSMCDRRIRGPSGERGFLA
jgi:pimeloyl-ACP methyl ester carboxylesterase